jgi:hypothetical protein
MKPSSNWRFAIAGVALIVVTNSIVLLGVAYNRKSPNESQLLLTERDAAWD